MMGLKLLSSAIFLIGVTGCCAVTTKPKELSVIKVVLSGKIEHYRWVKNSANFNFAHAHYAGEDLEKMIVFTSDEDPNVMYRVIFAKDKEADFVEGEHVILRGIKKVEIKEKEVTTRIGDTPLQGPISPIDPIDVDIIDEGDYSYYVGSFTCYTLEDAEILKQGHN